jgi:penicillin-binding protein 2
MRRNSEYGIITLAISFSLLFIIIICRYFLIMSDTEYMETGLIQSTVTVTVDSGDGTIYDRNMTPLVNSETEYIAVAVPQALDRNKTAQYAIDKEDFLNKYDTGETFTFRCTEDTEESEGLTVFSVPVRYSENQLAQHLIGYVSEDGGVSGIEAAYDKILRNYDREDNSVTYITDGYGRVLIGEEKSVVYSGTDYSGVVTTLDSDIQRICEEEGAEIEKGAIVVSEIGTGDIVGLVSFPEYSVYDLESALEDENSPMINRALYSYSVGSVFKLVIACESIEEGYGGFIYECNGYTDVNGKIFRCHDYDGHGIQTMTAAITNSCNPYFISLGSMLDVEKLRARAFTLGFGREIHLCSGITAADGVLPTVEELSVPAELANFSFGQGVLTASPIQISQMTCGIANGGNMPVMRLIKGITADGENIENEKNPQFAYTMEKETADKLCQLMVSAVELNEDSNARSEKISIGAKTSTAQTGRYDSDGTELYNAWITGFFPANNPIYAITVLVEDGGYGNDEAAPVFRRIAERIAESS